MVRLASGAEVGARLRRARLATGRSQAEVAAATGMSQSSVSRIELGRIGSVPISALAALATVVGHALEVTVRGPADGNGTAMQDRCHRLAAEMAARGGWVIWTRIDASDPSRSETVLTRPARREVAIIRVWDVIGNVGSAYAGLARRIAQEADRLGEAWTVSGAVIICATGHNRRRLSDAPRPTEDPFPVRGSAWLAALGFDVAMPRGIGMIWTDQTVQRLRPFLPYLDHRTRRRSATRRTRRQRPAA